MASQTAMNHLAGLWKRIRELQPSVQITNSQTKSGAKETNETINNDDFDNYLDSLENNVTTAISCEEIMIKLQQFEIKMKTTKRVPKTKHAMDFWEDNKAAYPELYELAQVVFAVAPTETSVERNFSALSFILNKYRCRLSDENSNEILFVRLNHTLFYQTHQ